MSQYPNPYPGPTIPAGDYYAAGLFGDLLGPARRAGMLLLVLGGIGLACGLCMGGVGAVAPWETMQLQPEQAQVFSELEETLGISVRTFMVIIGVVMMLPALLLGVLGWFVRGGGKVPIILAIVLVGLILAVLGLQLIAGIVQAAMNPAQAGAVAMNACVLVVMLGLFVLALAWLIQALRAASQLDAARQQWAWQYWQYNQQARQYHAGPPPGPGGA